METEQRIIDPNNTEKKFNKWKKTKVIDGVSDRDYNIIIEFLENMADGINCSKVKRGPRSYARLNNLKSHIPQIARWIKKYYDKDLIDVNEEEAIRLFNNLKKGEIKKQNGERYRSWDDYAKDFKSFWNWWVRYSKKKLGKKIDNIAVDIDSNGDSKPKFNYIDFDGYKSLRDEAKTDYVDLIDFLMDAGIRAPKELSNVMVDDISKIPNSDKLMLSIRDETSKTFGRKIKLMLCSDRILKRIKRLKLKKGDYLFSFNPIIVNRYLSRLGYKVLKIGERIRYEENVKGKIKIAYRIKNGLTLYDFRHISACYWITKYKSESALRYRFGWRTYKMIEYYTEFMGMKDTIQDDDLLSDIDKTQLEKELEKQKQITSLMEERLRQIELKVSHEENLKLISKMPKEDLIKKK